jgi:hypothetical protein
LRPITGWPLASTEPAAEPAVGWPVVDIGWLPVDIGCPVVVVLWVEDAIGWAGVAGVDMVWGGADVVGAGVDIVWA